MSQDKNIRGSWMNKRSKIVWSCDYVKCEIDNEESVMIHRNNQSKFIPLKTFLKNFIKTQ